jgi:hypothetical protein
VLEIELRASCARQAAEDIFEQSVVCMACLHLVIYGKVQEEGAKLRKELLKINKGNMMIWEILSLSKLQKMIKLSHSQETMLYGEMSGYDWNNVLLDN